MKFRSALLVGLLLGALVVGLSLSHQAFGFQIDRCPTDPGGDTIHFPFGAPDGPTGSDYKRVDHQIYELYNNAMTKFADWVAYCLDPFIIGDSSTSTSRNWKADPELDDDETLEPNDYKDAHAKIHTDRGHQAPLASFRGTGLWANTNYLSNITPQRSDLNQGSWVDLENSVRALVASESGKVVYVMTGPLYESVIDTLPKADEPHQIPSGYFKIIAVPYDDADHGIEAVGFIFDQETPRSAEFVDMIVPISEIETRTGYNFFPELSTEAVTALEEVSGEWPPAPPDTTMARPVPSDDIMQLDSELDGIDPAEPPLPGLPPLVYLILGSVIALVLYLLLMRR